MKRNDKILHHEGLN
ncbi:hypothetical protein ACMB9K_002104 [Escherichia coli]|nr:hypothetical protein [Escherichia coli]EHX8891214.1 hypothetical protein [Escherichia coli]EJK6122626.1 hypothetical protein [Escherichia coli]EJU0203576.1 hypothetical protein [Escherichia coli]EKD1074412.1 hypothetical protein [Escherichia coli]EKE4096255.1 hypothetical protein [Escherichia coli]